MCQRYSLTARLPELIEQFRIDTVDASVSYRPKYNLSPTQDGTILYEYRKERILDSFRWGFMPYWSKDGVNADGSAIGDRLIYRRIVNKQRCVIPCCGFYGWREDKKVRQPMRIVYRDKRTFAIPGFYEIWPRVDGGAIKAFTMLTTPASGFVADYSNRMPAILDEDGIDAWLSEDNKEYRQVYPAIRELPVDQLEAFPVGGYINDLTLETPDCAEPIRPVFAAMRR
ncbi:SOS response-associated peptidase [Cohnella thailandensis]|uniref:Abasic site processing protein n=1 Tax=Cohnella thailandensis TaxID=557557 RepID=A0A841T752_9BACL|nr:SOS response-associated peptidase [Cohnella thailandensis]MBB6637001.1 SOS response-associated peptidase [Cohnella thailandensis]MBP1973115.1 putative SOS response-associated peptidase YedK [Cohnella thailandensis]